MYLENSEQHNISGAGELSAEAMFAEQCQASKLTETVDLSSASKGSAELGITVFVEYTEQSNSREMDSGHCSVAGEEAEPFTYCNGHTELLEQYLAIGGLFESDHFADNCETAKLSQPCEQCAQLCECFKPYESSELCANHSLASRCNYYGHCVEQLFQQCESLGQQCDPDELLMSCDCCNQSDSIAEDHVKDTSDEQYEYFYLDPDTSAQDSDPCESTVSTFDLSNLVDSPDCQIQAESESTKDYNDLGSCAPEHRETGAYDEESCRLPEGVCSLFPSCDTPVHMYFDDVQHVCTVNGCYEECEGPEEQQAITLDMRDQDECDISESSQGSEEECLSDCSSLETKSFTTCPDGILPSDRCSDSSGKCDKVVQEDLSDEQTQWESFEEDEQPEQTKTDSNKEEKKTPSSDIVIEDYFDFFDRADYCRHQFSHKRHYISCFDGGDIDDCLHVEEALQRSGDEIEFEEISGGEADPCLDAPEEARDFTSGEHVDESKKNPEDWSNDLESSLADNVEDAPNYEYADSASEEDSCEDCDEDKAEVGPFSGKVDSMCAPCADDISVEGDAYEDDANSPESSTVDDVWACSKDREDKTFTACSEMEPYFLLQGNESDVEEYYACEIQSIQSSSEQALNEIIIEGQWHHQIIPGHVFGSEDAAFSLKDFETEVFCPDEQTTITEITGLAEVFANCFVVEKTINEDTGLSEQDDELRDISGDIRHQGVIHSVRKATHTEDSWVSEHSEDADEEMSDSESSESCECEYCIPPTHQVLEECGYEWLLTVCRCFCTWTKTGIVVLVISHRSRRLFLVSVTLTSSSL